ncbi:DUF5694 domain-containing protein [Kangiella marina]|uniref:DUF5694 domain-containing protein n=1 Tax=Kangiella marina TaxID=1079178 RepID=UPI0031EC5530
MKPRNHFASSRLRLIMGRAHTAFLREFIKRSPKFEMVDTLKYLEEHNEQLNQRIIIVRAPALGN